MTPQLAESICREFPHLTSGFYRQQPGADAGRLFNIGDGWASIFRRLLREIEGERLTLPPDQAAGVTLVEVFEKWAALRVCMSGGTESMADALDRAEAESLSTCEHCGTRDGVMTRTEGWWKTLCGPCDAVW